MDLEKALSGDQGAKRQSALRLQASKMTSANPSPAQEVDDGAVAFGDDITVVPTQASRASPRMTQTILDKLFAQRKESNKENIDKGPIGRQPRLIDAQKGAVRIDFESQDSQAQSSKPKRTREAEDEDDDFEHDSRRPKIQQSRNSKPHQTSKSNRYEVQRSDHSDTGAGVNDMDDAGAEPTIQQQPSRQSSIPTSLHDDRAHRAVSTAFASEPSIPRTQSIPRAETYRNVNSFAKANRKTIVRRQAFPQRRTPYSNEEVNRIIDLVEQYGTSWTLIKTMDEEHPDGPRLDSRTQVDIKDKCRNIVMDFYK